MSPIPLQFSLNDVQFLTKAVAFMTETLANRTRRPALVDMYPKFFRVFSDIDHIPTLTFYHRYF